MPQGRGCIRPPLTLSAAQGDVPSDLERAIKRSSSVPGPGAYRNSSRYTPDTPSFSMGEHNPKSDLDWAILRASEMPGPGSYGATVPPEEATRRARALQQQLFKSGALDQLSEEEPDVPFQSHA